MTQRINIRYQDEVKSRPINERFLDISKPSVLKGYNLKKGTGPFDITLSKGFHHLSSCVTPSGAKVSETEDLINILKVRPNKEDKPRKDAVYIKYEYGRFDAVATYLVVEGTTDSDPINPNPSTHLLLGWIEVPPRQAPLNQNSFRNVPKGIKIPELIGDTVFEGDIHFKGNVIVDGELDSSFGQDIQGTFIEKLPRVIRAEEGQTLIEVHKPYIMNSNSLFVYVNDILIMPNDILEMTPTTFRFSYPLKKGDRVWAFWFLKLQLIKTEEHDHDDRYYTKEELDKRFVIYDKGNFKGMKGEIIEHALEGLDYSVIGVIPTERATNIGDISVAKADDHIYVYNTGSYRGSFDIAYILNNDDDTFPHGIGNIYKTVAEGELNNTYRTVRRYRKNGTLHSVSYLTEEDDLGMFRLLIVEFFDYKGEDVVGKRKFNLVYDTRGRLIGTVREE